MPYAVVLKALWQVMLFCRETFVQPMMPSFQNVAIATEIAVAIAAWHWYLNTPSP
jgi:hypothetical protein